MTFGFDLINAFNSITNQMFCLQTWIMRGVSIVTDKTNFKTSLLEQLGSKYSFLKSSGL